MLLKLNNYKAGSLTLCIPTYVVTKNDIKTVQEEAMLRSYNKSLRNQKNKHFGSEIVP